MRDSGFRQARDRHDIAGDRLVDRLLLKAAEGEHLGDAALLDQPALAVEHLHGLVRLDRARRDAAGDQASEIGIGLENGAEETERPVVDLRRRDMARDEIEQRRHAGVLRPGCARRHPAFLG